MEFSLNVETLKDIVQLDVVDLKVPINNLRQSAEQYHHSNQNRRSTQTTPS